MTTYHAATPWEVASHGTTPGNTSIEVQTETGLPVAVMSHCGRAIENAKFICRAANCHDDLLAALVRAAKLIEKARQYFPKSMHNSDKFDLENTCATIGSAIAKAGGGQ